MQHDALGWQALGFTAWRVRCSSGPVDRYTATAMSARTCNLFVVALLVAGCRAPQSPQALEPFSTDGCSMFPDGRILACCTDHDIDYWQGGTADLRKAADRRFRACVAQTSGSAAFAEIAYRSVRVGGHPYLPPAAGWGYGWPFGRGYVPLNDAEEELVVLALRAALEVAREECGGGDEAACHLLGILERRPEFRSAP